MRTRGKLQAIGERFNTALDVRGEDIWRGTAPQIPIPDQTTGDLMSLVSTSVDDTAAGTGIQEIGIHYLDNNWEEQFITRATNGQTPVDITGINMKFIQDIHMAAVGSNGVAEGDITIYQTGDDTVIYDMVEAGGNMSLTISKMIPASHTLFLDGWDATASGGNKPVFIRIRTTSHEGLLYPGFLFKGSCNLESGGAYIKKWEKEARPSIPEKAIIKISAWATQSGVNVSCNWEGELLSNN